MTRRSKISLVGIMRQLVGEATAPKPGREKIAKVTGKAAYLLPGKLVAGDEGSVMAWTYRRLEGLGLGDYIIPTAEYFDDRVTTTQTAPTVSTYQGINGNIGREKDLSTSYFAVYSGQFELSETRSIRLRINTAASLWIGIDGETVLASDTLGPNQHTSTVFEVAAGAHTIEIGVYQASGRIKYEISGDLSKQVDKVLAAPDRTPPVQPDTPQLSIVLEPPAMRIFVEAGSSAFEPDRWGYRLYRAKTATATPPAFSAFSLWREIPETVPGAGVTAYDSDVEIGAFYHYVSVAVDREGNPSPSSPTGTIEAVDSTLPGSVTGVLLDDVPVVLFTTAYPSGTEVNIDWTDPVDSDLDHVDIYLYYGGGKPATRWANAWKIASVAAGVQHFWFASGVEPAASETFDIFIVPVDAYGNPETTPGGSYPGGATFTIDNNLREGDVVGLEYASGYEPNGRGWRKAATTLDAHYRGSGSAALFFFNWPPVDGDDFTSQLGASKSFDGETGSEGINVSCYAQLNDGSYTGVGQLRLRIDKTAPTNCSGLTATARADGIELAWTDGVDSASGILEIRIFRAVESTNIGDAVQIAAVPGAVETFVDQDVEADTRYTYWVQPVDRADNAGTASGGTVVYNLASGALAYLNWFDNSSFERGIAQASNPKWLPKGWELVGDWSSADHWGTDRPPVGFHGAHYPSLTSDRTIKRLAIPLLDSIFYLTFYARRVASGTPTPRARLIFKAVDGSTVQTSDLDYTALPDAATWSRADELASTSEPTFGPTGSGAAVTYPAGTHSVDVEFMVSGTGGINIDGLLLQEVYTDDGGSSWKAVETGETAPSTWVDSRVDNVDRINAWLGRFAQLYADNIIAGVLRSSDGSVEFDLDNGTLTIFEGSEQGYDVSTTISADGIQRAQLDDRITRAMFGRIFSVSLDAETSDGVVSGSLKIVSDIALYTSTPIPLDYFHWISLAAADYVEQDTSDSFEHRHYSIGQKASSTDPGHGYARLRTQRIGATDNADYYIDYSVYIRGASENPVYLAFVVYWGLSTDYTASAV